MICRSCRCQDHGSCRGGTWCYCQHRTTPQSVVKPLVLGPFEPAQRQEPNGNR